MVCLARFCCVAEARARSRSRGDDEARSRSLVLVRVEPSLTKQMSADFELAAADCVCTPPWVRISDGCGERATPTSDQGPPPPFSSMNSTPADSSARRIAMWFGVPNCLGRHEIAIAHGVGGGKPEKVKNNPCAVAFVGGIEQFPCCLGREVCSNITATDS